MVYDDYYNFNPENDYFQENQIIIKNDKNQIKNLFKIKRKINKLCNDNKFRNNIYLDLYSSDKYIKNSISGMETPYKVNSKFEDLFFKVKFVNGEIKNKDNITFFYDSPEQFENHQFVTLNDNTKKNWKEKYNNISKHIN